MDKQTLRKLIPGIAAAAVAGCIIMLLFVFVRQPTDVIRQTTDKPAHGKININTDYAFPAGDTPIGIAVNSAALLENADSWNGRVITFIGEAIGESMARGKMAWIHLNDDAYMGKNIEEGTSPQGYNSGHAIWLSLEFAKKINFFGDYKNSGDIVKVTGTFNSVCRDHGGDMDIHATSMEILKTGHPVDHNVKIQRIVIAIILLICAAILFAIQRIVVRQ